MSRGSKEECKGCAYMIYPIKPGYKSGCMRELEGFECAFKARYVAKMPEVVNKKKRKRRS